MENHNFPSEDISNGIWGPESGPNWPSCRVLKTEKIDELNRIGKFQGYSGMIYWGNKIETICEGHDGFCGPDNGPSCRDCLKEIFDDDEIIKYESSLKEIKMKIEIKKIKSNWWIIF